MNPITINYLAVLVCAIVGMIIGSLWYGPIFGKAWMKEIGKTEEDLRKDFNPAKTYTLAFLSTIVLMFVLAYFISLTGAAAIIDGIRVALVGWMGFTFFTAIIVNLFESKSYKLLLINSLYHLTLLIVGSIILILWV